MSKILALLTLAATTLALTACGSGGDASDTTGGGAGDGKFPVTVSQELGKVTIDAPPTRVVALDYPSADAALALGVVPVGMHKVTYVDGGVQKWTQQAIEELGGEEPELIETEGGYPFETIQALEPDVILATNAFPLISESWDQLNAIAPVVGHVEGPGIDDWQTGVRQVAKALGKEAEGAAVIDRVETKLAGARKRYPQLAGKTVSIFNYIAGDGLYVINDEEDASIRFFKSLGLKGLSPSVAALSGQEGRAKISQERYPAIEADVVIGTGPDPAGLEELEDNKLFRQVPAVARGSYLSVDIGEGTAMAFPSALSVPYAIDELAGKVAEAASASEG
jgi:iron complex transport system substrate-binding protein